MHWAWVVHAAPPMLQVPAPQVPSMVQNMLGLFEQWPPANWQSAVVKQVWVVPEQIPGRHWLDSHDGLPVQG